MDPLNAPREIPDGLAIHRYRSSVCPRRMMVGKLPVSKKEQLVLDDRKTDGRARLVVLGRKSLGNGEKALRVQIGVLVILEKRAVNLVGSGFDDHVQRRAASAPEFGIVRAGLNLEFGDRLQVHLLCGSA